MPDLPHYFKMTPERLAAALLCVANLMVAAKFLTPMRNRPVWDLADLYYAGKLVRSRQISQLYNRSAYQPVIAEVHRDYPKAPIMYFNRPAWEAPLFLPLAFFSSRARPV